jgi:signal transduction histidine kinase
METQPSREGPLSDAVPRNPAARLSALKVFALVVSAATLAYAGSRVDTLSAGPPHGAAGFGDRVLLHSPLLLMALASAYFAVISSPARFRAALAAKTALLCLYLLLAPQGSRVELPLVTSAVVEVAIYEPFYLNLLEAVALTGLAVLMRIASAFGAGAPGGPRVRAAIGVQAETALFLLVLAVATCLLVYYRERCIEQAQRLRHLNDAVTELARANLGYQHYASEAEQRSQSEERARITRELHDILGYTLTNNMMMLEAVSSRVGKDPAKVRELIDLARENAKVGLEKVRGSLHQLRAREPAAQQSSARRLHKLVDVFRIATGLRVTVHYGNLPERLPPRIESFFHFFVQEGLVNSFRHGSASEVRISFWRAGRGIVASIADNGQGAAEIDEGIGIQGMRERLAELGGVLMIRRATQGFEIGAEVPYDGEA